MSNLLIYKCETPLHVGAENSIGIIDMPIQREKHTGFPKIEASSIKGSFRNAFNKSIENSTSTNSLFGTENDVNAYSGSLIFSDARIFLFPVKSQKGLFAWITCPYVIERFKKDLEINNIKCSLCENNIEVNNNDEAIIFSKDSNIVNKDIKNSREFILLEQFKYKVEYREKNIIFDLIEKSIGIEAYIIEKLRNDVVIVSDDVFSYFVNMSTEINTRIKIGDDGVVEKGKLFTEEYVPAETIMYSFIDNSCEIYNQELNNKAEEKNIIRKQFDDYIKGLSYVQFGGNRTLGKGIVKVIKPQVNGEV